MKTKLKALLALPVVRHLIRTGLTALSYSLTGSAPLGTACKPKTGMIATAYSATFPEGTTGLAGPESKSKTV